MVEKDFGKAYQKLIHQMMAEDKQTAAVLVPEHDLMNQNEMNRKVNLNRFQQDIEARRLKQEARERQAQLEREAKELEGCTFAPKTKKSRRGVQADSPARDLNKFLLDQQRFEEEKRMKAVKAKEMME